MTINHSLFLEFECFGTVSRRANSYYVSNFQVFLFDQEVTRLLPKSDIDQLEEAFLSERTADEIFSGELIQQAN